MGKLDKLAEDIMRYLAEHGLVTHMQPIMNMINKCKGKKRPRR